MLAEYGASMTLMANQVVAIVNIQRVRPVPSKGDPHDDGRSKRRERP
jgi:hypothetical protein